MRNIYIIGIIAIVGLIYFFYNPVDNNLFPKCPFYCLTGLKCPGCGSQRAIHYLLHLDLSRAFKYNALLILSLPIVVVLGYVELNRRKYPNLYLKIHNVRFIWGYFITTISWWIVRNIFYV